MITFTINLAIAGIIFAIYYGIGVVALTILLFRMRNQTSPKLSLAKTFKNLPKVFLFAPLFPYIIITEIIDSKKSAKALARYRAQREAERANGYTY